MVAGAARGDRSQRPASQSLSALSRLAVGRGAPTGGPEALAEFLDGLPPHLGRTFVVLQHKELQATNEALHALGTEFARRIQEVLDSMPQQVAMLDNSGVIVKVNAAWERFARQNGAWSLDRTGVGTSYFGVCDAKRLPPRSEGHEARIGLERLLAGEIDRFVLEYPCHSPAEQRWFLMHAVRIDGTGGAVVSHVDVTDRKLAELNLRELAMVDPLTGVLNRRGLSEILAAEANRARRSASPLTAIVIDCDDFREINDQHGHAVGDEALALLARRLTEVLRPSDRLARVGGDEFVVLLPDTRMVEAAVVGDRLRLAAAREEAANGDTPLRLTVSMAVANVDLDNARIDEILRSARTSLNESRHRGKSRMTLATSVPGPESGRGSDVAALLDTRDSLQVFAQPIMHLATGRPVGHELLTRGPEGPFNLPEPMFRRAGEDGLLSVLDLRCLRECVAGGTRLEGWRHVNLYPATLVETPVHEILRLFPDHGQASSFCVELSEQQLLGAPSALREAVSALRRAGLRLGIDDVGFGRTSLEHLVLLEPEVVKIDRRWVAGVGRDRGRLQMLGRLIEVAHALGALVVAEGVEYADDATALLDLGAQFGQGYLWGKPARVPGPHASPD